MAKPSLCLGKPVVQIEPAPPAPPNPMKAICKSVFLTSFKWCPDPF